VDADRASRMATHAPLGELFASTKVNATSRRRLSKADLNSFGSVCPSGIISISPMQSEFLSPGHSHLVVQKSASGRQCILKPNRSNDFRGSNRCEFTPKPMAETSHQAGCHKFDSREPVYFRYGLRRHLSANSIAARGELARRRG